jgi:hypothetical protein
MKKIYMILSLILLLNFVNAGMMELESGDSVNVNLIAGDNVSFNVESFEEMGYMITDNKYNLNGLLVIYNGTSVTLSTPINFMPDNFIITFYDMTTIKNAQPEIVYVRSGGSTRYVDKIVNNTVNNTMTIIKYVEKDYPTINTTPIEINKTWIDEPTPSENDDSIMRIIFIVLAVAVVIIITVIIIRLIWLAFTQHTFV